MARCPGESCSADFEGAVMARTAIATRLPVGTADESVLVQSNSARVQQLPGGHPRKRRSDALAASPGHIARMSESVVLVGGGAIRRIKAMSCFRLPRPVMRPSLLRRVTRVGENPCRRKIRARPRAICDADKVAFKPSSVSSEPSLKPAVCWAARAAVCNLRYFLSALA